MSGASGVIYGIRALEVLAEDLGVMTHLVMTPTAKMNVEIETSWAVADVEALADEVHAHRDVAASIASGSFEADAMLIAP
ncbi:MAG: flavoprotein, partial [Actinomycetota bacterium]|nr:flavoprotein [Actinomycetota bacterium]